MLKICITSTSTGHITDNSSFTMSLYLHKQFKEMCGNWYCRVYFHDLDTDMKYNFKHGLSGNYLSQFANYKSAIFSGHSATNLYTSLTSEHQIQVVCELYIIEFDEKAINKKVKLKIIEYLTNSLEE